MQNFIEKRRELLVFDEHTCRHVCSSVKGGLEVFMPLTSTSYFLSSFFSSVSFGFIPFPLLHGGGGEKALIIYKC